MQVEATGEPVAVSAEPQCDAYATLIALINRLPEGERLVVTLHHLEGHPVNAIAEITGRPVGTVTKQLSRALQRLHGWARRLE